MSLSERLAERECKHVDCHEQRVTGALLCGRHLSDDWCRRLVKLADGTFIDRRAFGARDETAWSRAA